MFFLILLLHHPVFNSTLKRTSANHEDIPEPVRQITVLDFIQGLLKEVFSSQMFSELLLCVWYNC